MTPPCAVPTASETVAERRVPLLLLLLALTFAIGCVLVPFFGTVLWSMILALMFHPLNQWMLRRVRGRPTVAALLTMLIVVLLVILPLGIVTAGLVNESVALYSKLRSSELDPSAYFRTVFNALPQWAIGLLDRFGLGNFDALEKRMATVFSQGGQFIGRQALLVGQNTFELVASLFITLYLAFFLLRDGDKLVETLGRSIPLSPPHQHELANTLVTVTRATVKGNLLVAVAQGALGGLALWYLGVGGALLWAVLMAFLSLLPAVGAALVWGPVALYFLATGETGSGVGLIVWGVAVVGVVDNVLRPLLVGKDTRMPDYVVLITTLGGLAVFGINGFVLGPVIAAMFFAVWQIVVVRHFH